jgi:hypothetical protein
MGSLVYAELLNNPKYRKFLHRALPEIGHVGISHFFMTSLVGAAKEEGYGFLDFASCQTANIWIRPLISRNEDRLMLMLKGFILNLLKFSKPELRIRDAEWGEANIYHRQFIGGLSVLPWIPSPGELDFDLIVHVRLRIPHSQNGVPIMKQYVKMELWFEKFSTAEVQSLY